MHTSRLVFLVISGVAIMNSSVCAGRLMLVGRVGKQPHSAYTLYANANAPSSVQLAAEEIQRAVQIATGFRLPLSNTPRTPMICLGDNAKARREGLSVKHLPDDGFRIVTKGRNIYILGNDTEDGYHWRGWESRGTLFGAYEFLEKVVGVWWLMPGDVGEEIPTHKTVTVPTLNMVESPDFSVRELVDIQNQIRVPNANDSGPTQVDRWLLRHKNPNVSDGFKSTRSKILHGHAWNLFMTDEELKQHPEWQAVSGSRGKFCTSNPEAVEHFARGVIKWLDEHPDRRSAPISPEDGGDFCKCEKCKSQTEKDWHGNLSYTPVLLKFYNEVARIVAQKYPDRMLGGYVYYNYMYPPTTPTKMEPNVWLWLAPLNYYGWGLAKPLYRDELPKLIAAWTAPFSAWWWTLRRCCERSKNAMAMYSPTTVLRFYLRPSPMHGRSTGTSLSARATRNGTALARHRERICCRRAR